MWCSNDCATEEGPVDGLLLYVVFTQWCYEWMVCYFMLGSHDGATEEGPVDSLLLYVVFTRWCWWMVCQSFAMKVLSVRQFCRQYNL